MYFDEKSTEVLFCRDNGLQDCCRLLVPFSIPRLYSFDNFYHLKFGVLDAIASVLNKIYPIFHNKIVKGDIIDIFVIRLHELMRLESLSIADLSRRVNIPRTTINCWLIKTRLPKVDAIVRLADYFNVSTDYLLGRDDI